MPTKLTDQQLAEAKEAFALFDRDGDGCITTAELGTVMRSLGKCPSNAEIKDIVKKVDPDNRGVIDLREFLQVMTMDLKAVDHQKELEFAWGIFDTEKKGVLDANELKHILVNVGEKLSDAEIAELMKQADPNNTGKIKKAEFFQMMLHPTAKAT